LGEQVWLSHPGDLCFTCRANKGRILVEQIQTAIVKVVEGELVGPSEHPSTADVRAYLEMGRGFVATCQEDLDTASAVLCTLKEIADALEAEEKKATAPLNQSLKVIRGWFATGRKACQDARSVWEPAFLGGRRLMAQRTAQAAEQVHAAIAAGDSATAALAHKNVTPPKPTEGTQVRKVWQHEVVDFDAVPGAYKAVVAALVVKEMRAQLASHPDKVPVIPGVKFEQVEQLAVR